MATLVVVEKCLTLTTYLHANTMLISKHSLLTVLYTSQNVSRHRCGCALNTRPHVEGDTDPSFGPSFFSQTAGGGSGAP